MLGASGVLEDPEKYQRDYMPVYMDIEDGFDYFLYLKPVSAWNCNHEDLK